MNPLARIIRNINCLVSHVNKEENLNRVIDSILQIFLKLIFRCVAKAKLRRSASDDDQTLVPLHFFDSLGIGDSSVSHGGIAKSWRVRVVECEIVAKKRQSVLRSAANQYVFFVYFTQYPDCYPRTRNSIVLFCAPLFFENSVKCRYQLSYEQHSFVKSTS